MKGKGHLSDSSTSSKDEEQGLSSSGSSSHGTSNSTGPESSKASDVEAIITQKEEKMVTLSKTIVMMVLTLATIISAVATYKFMTRLERDQFSDQVSHRKLFYCFLSS